MARTDIDDATGVTSADADKTERSTREVIGTLVAALALFRPRHVVEVDPGPFPPPEPIDISVIPDPADVEVLYILQPEMPTAFPEAAVAGGGLKPGDAAVAELGGGTETPPPLPGGDAPRLDAGPEVLEPVVSVSVNGLRIESPISQLPETLLEADDDTLEGLRAALQDDTMPADTQVEIRVDDQLKFYRDATNQFVAPDFDLSQVDQPEPEQLTPVTIPLSQAEAISSQNQGDASTGDADIWDAQVGPQVALVDESGVVVQMQTSAEGMDAVVAQVDRVDEQAERTADTQDDSATGSGDGTSVAEQDLGLAQMMDGAFDLCFDPSDPAAIHGQNYVLERNADHALSLTAKDGRGVIFSRDSEGEIFSALTREDHQSLSAGYEVLRQQQDRCSVVAIPAYQMPVAGISQATSKGIELE